MLATMNKRRVKKKVKNGGSRGKDELYALTRKTIKGGPWAKRTEWRERKCKVGICVFIIQRLTKFQNRSTRLANNDATLHFTETQLDDMHYMHCMRTVKEKW